MVPRSGRTAISVPLLATRVPADARRPDAATGAISASDGSPPAAMIADASTCPPARDAVSSRSAPGTIAQWRQSNATKPPALDSVLGGPAVAVSFGSRPTALIDLDQDCIAARATAKAAAAFPLVPEATSFGEPLAANVVPGGCNCTLYNPVCTSRLKSPLETAATTLSGL